MPGAAMPACGEQYFCCPSSCCFLGKAFQLAPTRSEVAVLLTVWLLTGCEQGHLANVRDASSTQLACPPVPSALTKPWGHLGFSCQMLQPCQTKGSRGNIVSYQG